MANGFKPTRLAFTIFGISIIIVVILLQLTSDSGLGAIIQAPELRVVGGCFRDCLDTEQTGFGTIDCPEGTIAQEGVCVNLVDATLTTFNPDGSTTETQVQVTPDGKIIEPPTDDPTTPPDDQIITINNQQFEVLKLTNPIACWVSVDADIISSTGLLIDTEKSDVFKFAPKATLSLVDFPTGISVLDQGGFDIMLKIQCSTSIETGGLDPEGDLFNFFNIWSHPSFDTPLRLEPTKLTL